MKETKDSINRILIKKYGVQMNSKATLDEHKAELQRRLKLDEDKKAKPKKLIELNDDVQNMLTPGRYNVTGKFKAKTDSGDYKFTLHQIVEFDEETSIEKAKEMAVSEYIKRQRRNYNSIDEDAEEESPVDFLKIEEVDLKKIKNKDPFALQYEMFPDCNTNKGECVLDLIMYHMQAHTSFTKQDLLSELSLVASYDDEDFLKNGVSIDHFMSWVRRLHKETISCYVVDIFGHIIDHHIATNKSDVVISCLMNNNHLYPIQGEMKKYLSSQKKLKFEVPEFKIGYEECEVKTEYNYRDAISKVVYIDTDDLGSVINEITEETQTTPMPIIIHDSKPIKFKHPKKDQVFIASKDYTKRKDACKELFDKTKYIGFVWMNQTYAQIFQAYVDFKTQIKSSSYESHYSKDLHDVTNTYFHGGYNAKLQDATGEYQTFDRRGCYTSCILDNVNKYAIYSCHDSVLELALDAPIPIGKLYIAKDAYLGHMKFPLGWYPSFFVEYLIKHCCYPRKNVQYVIAASYTLPADFFKSSVEDLLSISNSKLIINSGIGAWGKRTRKIGNVAVTDSVDVALGMLSQDPTITVLQFGNLFHLQKQHSTPLLSGYTPLREHIVCMGHIKLFEMELMICGSESIILGYKTDSIQIIKPQNVTCKPKAECKPGDIHLEENKPLRGLNPDEIVGIPYDYKVAEYKVIEPLVIQEPVSFRAMAAGGYGKSYLLQTLFKRMNKVLKTCWTKSAALNIDGQTLDHVFLEHDTREQHIRKACEYDVIQVDEFSQISAKWWHLFVEIKMRKPSIVFQIYGDPKQLPAMDYIADESFDFSDNRVMHYLVDGNECKLEYREKEARYTKRLKMLMDYFLENGKVPNVFTFDKSLCGNVNSITICKTDAKRREINEQASATRDGIEFKNVKNENVKLFDGGYLISFENYNEVINSTRYKINNTTKEKCDITPELGGATITMSIKELARCMRNGYADTVTRLQSRTIKGKYSIVETDYMTRNDLNVALTRATDIENINMITPTKKFEFVAPQPKNRALTLKRIKPTLEYVYKITDGVNSYIGSTNNYERRMKEHEEFNVSKKVEQWKKDNKLEKQILHEVMVLSKKQIVKLEYSEIGKIPEQVCMNTLGVIAETKTKVKEINVDYSKFKILEEAGRSRYFIKYQIKGQTNNVKFSYGPRSGQTKEQAKQEAETFRKQLIFDTYGLRVV